MRAAGGMNVCCSASQFSMFMLAFLLPQAIKKNTIWFSAHNYSEPLRVFLPGDNRSSYSFMDTSLGLIISSQNDK
jgi:hypothetical protein